LTVKFRFSKKLAVFFCISLVLVWAACTTAKVSTPSTPQSQPVTNAPQATPQPEKESTEELQAPAKSPRLKAGQRKAVPAAGSTIQHAPAEMVPDSLP
jgi:hypothetical protein